jgi:hypothetical protein
MIPGLEYDAFEALLKHISSAPVSWASGSTYQVVGMLTKLRVGLPILNFRPGIYYTVDQMIFFNLAALNIFSKNGSLILIRACTKMYIQSLISKGPVLAEIFEVAER